MTDTKLAEAIRNVAERIDKARKHNRGLTEEDTKVSLITPILRALSWDIENFQEVRFEYRHKTKDPPVDYALFLHRNPVLFVEAKALDTNLSEHKWIAQTISYAATVGVTWCVLTNGDEYRLYNAHAPVEAAKKLFHTIRLTDLTADQAVTTMQLLSRDNMVENTLNTVWDAHFVDRQVKAVLESLIANQDQSLIRLLAKRTNGISSGKIRKSLARAEAHFDFPMIQPVPLPKELDAPAAKQEASPHASQPKVKPAIKRHREKSTVQLIDIISAGLIEVPLPVEVTYLKKRATATVQPDGSVNFNGETFASLSTAAGAARTHVKGQAHPEHGHWPTNGWKFWRFADPETGTLQLMHVLRERYFNR